MFLYTKVMNYETFIARRYMKSGKKFLSLSTWISIIGVMLGVGVVCFVMALHNGFESEIRTRLLGTTSHISIFPKHNNGIIEDYMPLVEKVEKIDGVVAASPFIYYKTAIASKTEGDGVMVRGIIPELEEHTANIKKDIKQGEYDFSDFITEDDTIPGMVIGNQLANRLGVYLGETVVLYSLKKETLTRHAVPRVAKFYISGIFETGMHEFDGQLAYISLDAAQKLFKTGNGVTAIHLKLEDIYKADELSGIIDGILGFEYDVVPWNVLYRQLFTWIEIEKIVLMLGFLLIVLVAAFSIVSTLVMMTMEKRQEIGILKTIGLTPTSVRKIFIYNGLWIGGGGVFAGWLLALVAIFIQNKFEVISLPPDIYFISYLPFVIKWYEFLMAGAVTIVICFFAALFPAHQAAKLSVIKVLRK